MLAGEPDLKKNFFRREQCCTAVLAFAGFLHELFDMPGSLVVLWR
jgi:hypothetical protein